MVQAEEEAVSRVTHQGKLGSESGPGVCAEGSRWGSREWGFLIVCAWGKEMVYFTFFKL